MLVIPVILPGMGGRDWILRKKITDQLERYVHIKNNTEIYPISKQCSRKRTTYHTGWGVGHWTHSYHCRCVKSFPSLSSWHIHKHMQWEDRMEGEWRGGYNQINKITKTWLNRNPLLQYTNSSNVLIYNWSSCQYFLRKKFPKKGKYHHKWNHLQHPISLNLLTILLAFWWESCIYLFGSIKMLWRNCAHASLHLGKSLS